MRVAFYYAISRAKSFRLLKGESITKHDILGSMAAKKRAVTAPILLPHKPIYETFPHFLK